MLTYQETSYAHHRQYLRVHDHLGVSECCTLEHFCQLGLIDQLHEAHAEKLLAVTAERREDDDTGETSTFLDTLWIDCGPGAATFVRSIGGSLTQFTVHALTVKQAEAVLNDLLSNLPEAKPKKQKPKRGEFGVISTCHGDPERRMVPLPKPSELELDDLTLLYGTDGAAWTLWAGELLLQRQSGLFLLTGPPGTGKTSLLRHLITKHEGEVVFYYLGAKQWELFEHPAFVNFWIDERPSDQLGRELHKVIIIEDADELVRARDEGDRCGLSVLLNASDGLLADMLRVTIIATCNTPITRLDPAITRHGRLLGYRDFPRIESERAARIAKRFGKTLNDDGADDYSLADIFAHDPGITTKATGQAPIGFGVGQ